MDEELGKLIEPTRISFSFNEPGWYILGVISFILIFLIITLWIRHKQKNAYRKQALRLLKKQEDVTGQNDSLLELIYDSNNLMKRIAVKKYGRQKVADKTGQDWITLLNSSAKAEIFDQPDVELLSQSLYEADETNVASQAGLFTSKVKVWIQKHKNAL